MHANKRRNDNDQDLHKRQKHSGLQNICRRPKNSNHDFNDCQYNHAGDRFYDHDRRNSDTISNLMKKTASIRMPFF